MRNKISNIELLEYYYGDLIEKIILEYNYQIDLDDDYDYLLRYVYKSLIKTWFNGKDPTPEEFESKLKRVRERFVKKLEILLSYVIARYSNNKGEEVMRRVRYDD